MSGGLKLPPARRRHHGRKFQDRQHLGQVAGLAGRLKPAARLSVVIQVDGKPSNPSMAECMQPTEPAGINAGGSDRRLKDSGPRAFLPSISLTF